MSREDIPQGATLQSLITWLAMLILVAAIILALGFSSGAAEVVNNLPAHIAYVLIMIILGVVAYLGKSRSQIK